MLARFRKMLGRPNTHVAQKMPEVRSLFRWEDVVDKKGTYNVFILDATKGIIESKIGEVTVDTDPPTSKIPLDSPNNGNQYLISGVLNKEEILKEMIPEESESSQEKNIKFSKLHEDSTRAEKMSSVMESTVEEAEYQSYIRKKKKNEKILLEIENFMKLYGEDMVFKICDESDKVSLGNNINYPVVLEKITTTTKGGKKTLKSKRKNRRKTKSRRKKRTH